MAHLSAATRTRLQADLATVVAQIDAANAALTSLVAKEIESYRLDTGEASQQAKRVDIEKLERLISRLEARADRIRQRLAGAGVVNLNVRRMDGL
jgi:hypothetical protein